MKMIRKHVNKPQLDSNRSDFSAAVIVEKQANKTQLDINCSDLSNDTLPCTLKNGNLVPTFYFLRVS